MPEDSRIPIILGRPFLVTARAMIDVFDKKITLRIGDDQVTFDMEQSMKRPSAEDDESYNIDELDETINKETQKDFAMMSNANEIDEKRPELKDLPSHLEYAYLYNDKRFFQIPIAPEDQEKTTFTYPYGTFAYRRTPFRLCNAPTTLNRCMTAIFHDMVEDFMEVFMDSVHGRFLWSGIKVVKAKIDVIAKLPPNKCERRQKFPSARRVLS
ncbi:hypothetical protein Tco_0768422 [Tanacetum coccineum]